MILSSVNEKDFIGTTWNGFITQEPFLCSVLLVKIASRNCNILVSGCLLAARLPVNICNLLLACLFICWSFSVRHCNIVVTCGQILAGASKH